MALNGQEGEKEQCACAKTQVTEQARGGKMAVRQCAGEDGRDEGGKRGGSEGVGGEPLEAVGLKDSGKGDKPEGNCVRQDKEKGAEKETVSGVRIRSHVVWRKQL